MMSKTGMYCTVWQSCDCSSHSVKGRAGFCCSGGGAERTATREKKKGQWGQEERRRKCLVTRCTVEQMESEKRCLEAI